MTRISSPDSPRHPAGAAISRPPAQHTKFSPLTIAALGVLAVGVAGHARPAHAQATVVAQNSAAASIQAQIRRYGCNLPQYANSVEACRRLNARAKALGATPAKPAPSVARRSSAPRARSYPAPAHRSVPQPQIRPGGGILGMLFGAPNPDRYRRRSTYDSDQDYYYSPSPSGYGTYRTLCVRLCDGYYWPISYSTVRGRFTSDAQQCTSSCGTEVRLYFHANPGGAVESMVDMEGKPYMDLPNAFRYRREYDSSCRCKPEPWSEAAKEDYQRRAEAEAAKENGAEPVTADANDGPQPEAAPAPAPVASRPASRRRKGFWHSFLPFGRWSSGG